MIALRALRRSSVFTVVAVATLALGICASAVVFAMVKGVLINPLPFGEPDRIVTIVEADAGTPSPETTSVATAMDLKRLARSFDHLSLWGDYSVRPLLDGRAEMLRGMRVSADFFDTLGVPMYLGRAFRADDDAPGRRNVLILTYGTWVESFGADPGVVGRSIPAADGAYTVLGVLAPQFHPLHMSNPAELPRVFLMLRESDGSPCRLSSCRGFRAIARLKAGVTPAAAEADLNTIMGALVRAYPSEYAPETHLVVTALRDRIVAGFGPALWMLQGAVLLLLVLACANVAMLMVTRTLARQHELAVRAALGASVWRLVRDSLAESLILAAAATVVGVSAAWGATRLLSRVASVNLPRIGELTPDRSLLWFGVAAGVFTAILFGLAPAIVGARGARSGLRAAATSAGSPAASAWIRALIGGEIALAFVLVFAVGLLAKSYARVLAVDPGFDPDRVLTLSLLPALPGTHLPYFDAVVDRVRAIAGVQDAAYASTLPLSHPSTARVSVREHPLSRDATAPNLDAYLVSPSYLRAMRIQRLRGRDFSARDSGQAAPVAIVSESAARLLFPGEDPVGRHIRVAQHDDEPPWSTVVGVVRDVHQYGLERRADPAVYVPFAQYPAQGWASLVVRSTVPSSQIEAEVRRAMSEVDARQPIFHLQPMATFISLSVAQRAFTLALIAAFGALAFLLAAGGVYGVVSYLVAGRTREFGVRLALGATPAAVKALILRQVLMTSLAGIAVGLVAAGALGRGLAHHLFQVSPLDGGVVAGAAGVLVAAALLAAYRPVARAAAVDPMSALRSDG